MLTRAFYTVPELAELIGVKDDKVRAWITSGELTASNFATRTRGRPRLKISAEAFAQFQAARAVIPKTRQQRKRKRTTTATRQWIQ